MKDACWLIALLGKLAEELNIDRGELLDKAYQIAADMIKEDEEQC